MTQLSIQFFDGSILYIDLIRKFKRKATLFMDSQEVLEKVRKLPSGLAVPQPEHDFEYAFLFYNLNGEKIPHKYHSFFSAGGHFKSRILKYMGAKYLLTSSSFEDLFKLDKEGRAWLKMIVRHRSIQQPISFLSNRIHYGLDLLKTMRKDRGFIITFSGVDGSGKSTIIDRFKNELRTIHRKEVVLLRHRPRLLPILSAMKYGGVKAAEQRAGEIQPRKGKAKAGLGSALRFCYYYTDYLIGQSYIYFKYILRGKIVLYDRYYFDFIVDAKRSNITMPPKLVKQLYTLIYKPKYNFLLWSNPEAVYQRKPEVEIEQISSLNQGYKVLFKELEHTAKHATYRIVHNQQIDSTVKQILRECREVA
jgi:thymidylate kinase